MVLLGSIYSKILGMESGITVITPNDYGQAKKYRVCYVFHGMCGGNGDFSNFSLLPYLAYDKDVIYICPEVQHSFYCNMKHGYRYFDYVASELPQTVKLVFNISASREDTAVMGCSMGGYGALKCALTYPENYGFCAAFSPAFTTLSEEVAKWKQKGRSGFPFFYNIIGRDMEYDVGEDITVLAEKALKNGVYPRLYVTTGTKDTLRKDNLVFKERLEQMGYPFEFDEIEGKHDYFLFEQGVRRAVERMTRDDTAAKPEAL